MQFAEVVEVLEHRANDFVDHFFSYIGAGDEGRHHAEGGDVGVGGLVGALRDGREGIERIGVNQAFFDGRHEVDDLGATAIGSHGHARVGHTDRVTIGVDLTIAQGVRLFGR